MARNDAMRTALSTTTAAILMATMAMAPATAAGTGPVDVEEIGDISIRAEPAIAYPHVCGHIYAAKATLLDTAEDVDDGVAVETGQDLAARGSVETAASVKYVAELLVPGSASWDGNEEANWSVEGDQVWDPVLQECVWTGNITVSCDCPGAFGGKTAWSSSVVRDTPPAPDSQGPNVQKQANFEWTVSVPDPDVYQIQISTGGGIGGTHSISFHATG